MMATTQQSATTPQSANSSLIWSLASGAGITWSFLALVLALGISDLFGSGHQYAGVLMAFALFLGVRALPPRGIRALIMAMLWISIAVALLALIQMAMGFPRARGPFFSPNVLGYYAVAHLFLALWLTERPALCDLAAFANLFALILSGSRASWLAAMIGACCWYPPMVLFLPTAALLVLFLPHDGAGIAVRLHVWEMGIGIASQHPWLGWGQGGAALIGWPSFYNLPIDLLAAGGIIGLGCGAVLAIAVGGAARVQPPLRAFLAAWIVNSLFMYQSPASLVPLMVVLGVMALPRSECT